MTNDNLTRRDFVAWSVAVGLDAATGSRLTPVTTTKEEPMQYLVQMNAARWGGFDRAIYPSHP